MERPRASEQFISETPSITAEELDSQRNEYLTPQLGHSSHYQTDSSTVKEVLPVYGDLDGPE